MIGSGRHEALGLQHHFARAQRAHVQPNGGRSRAAVERKRHRTLGRVLSIQRISDKKHFSFDFAVAALDRQPARGRRVFQQLAVNRDLVVRHHGGDFGHVVALFLVLLFVARAFSRPLFLRCGCLGRTCGGRSSLILGRLGCSLCRWLLRVGLRRCRVRLGQCRARE